MKQPCRAVPCRARTHKRKHEKRKSCIIAAMGTNREKGRGGGRSGGSRRGRRRRGGVRARGRRMGIGNNMAECTNRTSGMGPLDFDGRGFP